MPPATAAPGTPVAAGPPGRSAPATAPAKNRRARRGRELRAGLLFSLPAVVLLLLFMVAPFVSALVLSFTDQRLVSPRPVSFVGLENYVRVLTDAQFWGALTNNVVFALIVVPLQTGAALGLAVLVNRRLPGRVLFRTIYFLPTVTVMAVAATVWKLLLLPDGGMVNGVLDTLTFGQLQPGWLSSTSWAMPAIVITSIWQGVGFQMIIFLAGLQAIPASLYEAATMDGANAWQQFRNVTLPGLRNTLIFVLNVTVIFAFRLFDQVYIMPQFPGGPLDSTRTMMLQLLQTGYGRGLIGQASAIAVIFFLFVLAVTLVQRRFSREERAVQ
ncbi:carbohydrate ABC transporter permease [Allostreptomyces psammosilenae]|uniref:Multiple sugar transport system permease protein n=1 Tax=Allostreptomyces psammosilenae TaxID=1892865 RepID=A0A852ZUC4_9ACTN|nr:sugar ABC transporter permease [Allostreptomyces psammosilenae]NYI05167.1 multiple sugar transport system permease protein [Allostreptomyces psammosilenae]